MRRHLIPLELFGILAFFLSGLSCQNMERAKNKPFQKALVEPIIDQSYFEQRADSAYLKGEEAFFEGNSSLALRHFKTALLFAPQSSLLRERIAQTYEREGLLAEALSRYKTLDGLEAKKPLKEKLTEIYYLQGLNKKALEQNQLILKEDPASFALWLRQAGLLIQEGDWMGALKAIESSLAAAEDPNEEARALLLKAYAFARLKNIPKGLQAINRLDSLPIYEDQLALKSARFYRYFGRPDLALASLERFQKDRGAGKAVAQELLEYYISAEDWGKAQQNLERIQALGQLENHHRFYMAMLLLDQKQHGRAIGFLKDLALQGPAKGQSLYLLGGAYEQTGEWKLALQSYRQAPAESPYFLAARLQSAHLLKRMGQEEKSLSLLKKLSFASNGDISPQALLTYAESLWDLGRKGQAIKALSQGLKREPFQPDLLFLRGLYLKRGGLWLMALKDMYKILKIKENHEEALGFIASSYSEQNIYLGEAERLARKALSLKPHSIHFLRVLGWILFQKGDFKPALRYLSRAFLKSGGDSLTASRLGQVHFQLKNFKKSDYFFEEALKLEKNENQREEKKAFSPQLAFRP